MYLFIAVIRRSKKLSLISQSARLKVSSKDLKHRTAKK